MILYFDTETTGLSPGRIIQLSYIMQTEKETKAKNFFFYVDYVEPSAAAVHGFTPEKLFELSGGKTFSCDIDEIYDDFLSADLIVSHNFAFDLKFMMAEFAYQDRRFRYRESLCTMRYFTDVIRLPRSSHRGFKYPKLQELAEYYDVYPYDISRMTAEYFGCLASDHDARYDTASLYLSFNAAAAENAAVHEIREKYLSSPVEEKAI
ncbi:MAG: 3'-5' exonuclease [Clostridia bacterium]|nr:3'-5' exonuclease [Clostridia bacterium]